MKRIDIKAILKNPVQRRELMVQTIIATQAREGVTTTRAQAEAAYDAVQKECAKTRKPAWPGNYQGTSKP